MYDLYARLGFRPGATVGFLAAGLELPVRLCADFLFLLCLLCRDRQDSEAFLPGAVGFCSGYIELG